MGIEYSHQQQKLLEDMLFEPPSTPLDLVSFLWKTGQQFPHCSCGARPLLLLESVPFLSFHFSCLVSDTSLSQYRTPSTAQGRAACCVMSISCGCDAAGRGWREKSRCRCRSELWCRTRTRRIRRKRSLRSNRVWPQENGWLLMEELSARRIFMESLSSNNAQSGGSSFH